MLTNASPIAQRVKKLQAHLAKENPVLLDVVKSFRQLDRAAYALGILGRDESFATQVPWWPMISVLGTFSAGKSTFINGLLGAKLQKTGNQAVDDKFTVICFAPEEDGRTLPGRALDADPRFPFYQIGEAIEECAPGEGERVDTYLQLKTTSSARMRGKILIDSPGFDADEQRNSTLRITDRIMDLSDLVLVLFDARHPEPGAMKDTLDHLVSSTIHRADANKFLYVLNQIDNAAREDNPEEVFAAWQRALAQKGLTAGRFYSLYSPEAAIVIDDPNLERRFRAKRDEDMAALEERIDQIEVERAYRIIGVLDQLAKRIRDRAVPAISRAKERWRRRVLWADGVVFGGALAAFATWSISAGYWDGLVFTHPWYAWLVGSPIGAGLVVALLVGAGVYVHFAIRGLAARSVLAGIRRDRDLEDVREWVADGFRKNIRPWQWTLSTVPIGWSRGTRRRVEKVIEEADRFVQALNSQFADPSGQGEKARPRGAPLLPVPERQTAAPADAGEDASEPGSASVAPPADYVTESEPAVVAPIRGNQS